MSLLGNGVFADIIKVGIEMRHTGLQWALNPMSVLKRDRKRHTETHREEGHVKTETEKLPQARDCQEPRGAGGTRKNSPLESPEIMWPYQQLGLGFL